MREEERKPDGREKAPNGKCSRQRLRAKRKGKPGDLSGCKAHPWTEHIDRVTRSDRHDRQDTEIMSATTLVLGCHPRDLRWHTEDRIAVHSQERYIYNTAGGRCEACEGQGVKTIELSVLPT